MKAEKLFRFPNKGYIGGVCHGLGEHTGIDPILWRIVTVFGGFWFVYLILWIFLKKGE
jgi:phage shock protein C